MVGERQGNSRGTAGERHGNSMGRHGIVNPPELSQFVQKPRGCMEPNELSASVTTEGNEYSSVGKIVQL
jgi:hypothetical protein